ncbi:hypothetical protein KTR66_05290 [Roseococcus sp. SDR]|uniref:hypothetical protein n=1 Tax=unclassified Roseococcus TaxID=2639982 RepID=UPI001BCBFCF1|nr:hypothetical protein [Roseococcus sp. SDR]MBS7789396.1 hypothetical protein [Roseococcus sp. SDR]MBV1844710.1 hypothetical protein [Roseococcus sp. SDR]
MSGRGERRWIVLAQDGRHVSLGRAAPPTAEEIATASDGLARQGLAGWIATLDGAYWGRARVTLTPVRTIGADTTLDWPAAVAAFEQARQRARRAA